MSIYRYNSMNICSPAPFNLEENVTTVQFNNHGNQVLNILLSTFKSILHLQE